VNLWKAFLSADVDESGDLSFDEFRSAAVSIGLGVGERDMGAGGWLLITIIQIPTSRVLASGS
jgi:hypothetical protein